MNKVKHWVTKSLYSITLLILTVAVAGCSTGAKTASSDGSSASYTNQTEATDSYHQADEGQQSTSSDVATTGKGVTMIGDSVTVGIAPYLKEKLPEITIDGKVGRQMRQATQVIQELSSQGNLGDYVILELGTNGPFDADQLRTVLRSLADRKQVILVTSRVPKGWQDQVNETITQVAPEFSNTKVVDWYTASTNKDSYFYQDGVHLKPDGSKYYASLLINAIQNRN